MVSGADNYYPTNYVEEIVSRMRENNVVITSGVYKGERSEFPGVRGRGRIIEAEWFKTIGFKYPENYEFEHYPVYKALMDGKHVAVYDDLEFLPLRLTLMSSRKAFFWG